MPDSDSGAADREVIIEHYASLDYESGRLAAGSSRIEFARTKELLARFLPQPPAEVLDVGGGPGVYATWLSELGYRLHLVDITPLHVQQALDLAARRRTALTAEVGDARRLAVENRSWDAVMLLGPLYHLTSRTDRITALREAKRAVREDGVVVAAAISRLASILDGVRLGYLLDPQFRTVVERDLKEGQHRNPDRRPDWFTTAYFHGPAELRDEVIEAGLELTGIYGVEGPGWLRPELWDHPANHEALLWAARMIEQDPDGAALSAHLLAVARG